MTHTDASSPLGPEALDVALGIRFEDEELREMALTHRSYAFEHGVDTTNERLEFLGDSVLGLVVTDMAFAAFPEMPEGELAKLRAAMVNAQALADVARSLGLGALVRLGKGEEQSGGRDKASILADALEAVFGAVYLEQKKPEFADWWAHTPVQEKAAFEGFVDWAFARWSADRSRPVLPDHRAVRRQ